MMFVIRDDAGDKFGMPDADIENVIRAAQELSAKINKRLTINRVDGLGEIADSVADVWPSCHVDLSLFGSTIA